MAAFIKLQYRMGKIDEKKVRSYVGTWLTSEQANEILSV